MEETSQAVGQTPVPSLDDCLNMLLSCFRKRMSVLLWDFPWYQIYVNIKCNTYPSDTEAAPTTTSPLGLGWSVTLQRGKTELGPEIKAMQLTVYLIMWLSDCFPISNTSIHCGTSWFNFDYWILNRRFAIFDESWQPYESVSGPKKGKLKFPHWKTFQN